MSPEGGDPSIRLAAFDVDGTLTTRDSVVPFLLAVGGRRTLMTMLGRHGPRVAHALVRRDRDRLRAVATRAVFTGRPVEEVAVLARAHADAIARDRLRDDTRALLDRHRRAGHLVALVSASYEDYLIPLGARLGVDGVIGTRLEVVGDRCTGRLAGANCRGSEKVRRLAEWLEQRGLRRTDLEVWAYGDSSGDLELLEWADHPAWVRDGVDSVAPLLPEDIS